MVNNFTVSYGYCFSIIEFLEDFIASNISRVQYEKVHYNQTIQWIETE